MRTCLGGGDLENGQSESADVDFGGVAAARPRRREAGARGRRRRARLGCGAAFADRLQLEIFEDALLGEVGVHGGVERAESAHREAVERLIEQDAVIQWQIEHGDCVAQCSGDPARTQRQRFDVERRMRGEHAETVAQLIQRHRMTGFDA